MIKKKIESLVSRETLIKFEKYEQILGKWQKKINLVSNDSLKDFWNRHLFDSLQLINYIPDNSSILDVGTGGGFPGAVLAICEKYDVTCVDSDLRKCCFLNNLFGELNVKANVINDRIEKLFDTDINVDFVTARGFSSLSNILEIIAHFKCSGALLKGKTVKDEISLAKDVFLFDYELNKSETSDDGFILVIKECRRK